MKKNHPIGIRHYREKSRILKTRNPNEPIVNERGHELSILAAKRDKEWSCQANNAKRLGPHDPRFPIEEKQAKLSEKKPRAIEQWSEKEQELA
jgi:hypothetical protein